MAGPLILFIHCTLSRQSAKSAVEVPVFIYGGMQDNENCAKNRLEAWNELTTHKNSKLRMFPGKLILPLLTRHVIFIAQCHITFEDNNISFFFWVRHNTGGHFYFQTHEEIVLDTLLDDLHSLVK